MPKVASVSVEIRSGSSSFVLEVGTNGIKVREEDLNIYGHAMNPSDRTARGVGVLLTDNFEVVCLKEKVEGSEKEEVVVSLRSSS